MKLSRVHIIAAFLFVYCLCVFVYYSWRQPPNVRSKRQFILAHVEGDEDINSFLLSCTVLNFKVHVFYDDVSEEYLMQHSTRQIQFIHSENVFALNENENRLQLIEHYLHGYARSIDDIIIVDPKLVFFYRSPFQHNGKLHVSLDVGTMKTNSVFASTMHQCLQMNIDFSTKNLRVYNANVIAGPWRLVKHLLYCIRRFDYGGCEMAALNFCLHFEFQRELAWKSMINPLHLQCDGKYAVTQNSCHELLNTDLPCLVENHSNLQLVPCSKQ